MTVCMERKWKVESGKRVMSICWSESESETGCERKGVRRAKLIYTRSSNSGEDYLMKMMKMMKEEEAEEEEEEEEEDEDDDDDDAAYYYYYCSTLQMDSRMSVLTPELLDFVRGNRKGRSVRHQCNQVTQVQSIEVIP